MAEGGSMRCENRLYNRFSFSNFFWGGGGGGGGERKLLSDRSNLAIFVFTASQ